MKCQRCPKQATLHITEVLGEERFEELHLCEDCAKKYLYEPAQQAAAAKKGKQAIEAGPADDPMFAIRSPAVWRPRHGCR